MTRETIITLMVIAINVRTIKYMLLQASTSIVGAHIKRGKQNKTKKVEKIISKSISFWFVESQRLNFIFKVNVNDLRRTKWYILCLACGVCWTHNMSVVLLWIIMESENLVEIYVINSTTMVLWVEQMLSSTICLLLFCFVD